jgi:hypothetical protein
LNVFFPNSVMNSLFSYESFLINFCYCSLNLVYDPFFFMIVYIRWLIAWPSLYLLHKSSFIVHYFVLHSNLCVVTYKYNCVLPNCCVTEFSGQPWKILKHNQPQSAFRLRSTTEVSRERKTPNFFFFFLVELLITFPRLL